MVSVETTIFSKCGLYRYTLRRSNLFGSKRVCFFMLNPSKASAVITDRTTVKAMGFSSRLLDCKEYLAVNLFAWRDTDPKGLKKTSDPIGPDNDKYLLAAVEWADEIVIAWGAGGVYLNRNEEVLELLKGRSLLCLGKTKEGHPNFPLYLPKDTELEIWELQ